MKPLLVLIVAFVVASFGTRIYGATYNFACAGGMAMSVMLLFTAMAHFAFTKGMSMMMPKFIPFKKGFVFFTGIVEIIAAIGLQIPQLKIVTAWLLMPFFILILPANIYAAANNVDYRKGSFEGKGLSYLWFRIPLQIFFIVWVYFFSLWM